MLQFTLHSKTVVIEVGSLILQQYYGRNTAEFLMTVMTSKHFTDIHKLIGQKQTTLD